MNRWKVVWAAAAAGLLICGCARAGRPENKFLPQVSSIYVAKDGEIFSATVEPWEDGEYDSASLRQFITDEVAAYNESLGASALPFAEGEEAPLPVAVDSCQAGEGKLWVVYRYKDSEAFRDFAREYHDKANETISFGTGTALAGQEAGWFTGGDFVKLGRGDEVTAARQKDLERLEKERVVMVEADHSIILQTEGKILYVTRNVAVLGKNTVQIPEGKHYVVFR